MATPHRWEAQGRWTDETLRGAVDAAFPGLLIGMSLEEASRRVGAALDYLANQGLLVPPTHEQKVADIAGRVIERDAEILERLAD